MKIVSKEYKRAWNEYMMTRSGLEYITMVDMDRIERLNGNHASLAQVHCNRQNIFLFNIKQSTVNQRREKSR
jgi:tRNA A37 threonylcarbamoyladenosine dehydratase